MFSLERMGRRYLRVWVFEEHNAGNNGKKGSTDITACVTGISL